ncbi:hypothetical protein HYH03_001875 [Edaphochlamys debaryana]|uniref:Peptidase M11 gametolysin domain-containing protein n=1 Tax=Edaphochlamys debaryana TaxID=47281 RepID=A0A835YC98_9CHLO|nr:hypothetical protein HYH03_001875 [Edaphochlamys debaryana]|eukprot:KAG2500297.1 hypothetical protein HYH03_001875 [Edaphochlamys debaryana]
MHASRIEYALVGPRNASDPSTHAAPAARLPFVWAEGVEAGERLTGSILKDVPLELSLPPSAMARLGLDSPSPASVRVGDLLATVRKEGLQGALFGAGPARALGPGVDGPPPSIVDMLPQRNPNVSSLVFIMHAPSCGLEMPWSVSEIERSLFKDAEAGAGNGGVASLEAYLETCSWGQLRYPRTTNHLYGPIDVGACRTSGPSMGAADLGARCGPAELEALVDRAKAWLKENDPDVHSDWKRYKTIRVMFPFREGCDPAGGDVASIGCPSGQDCVSSLNVGSQMRGELYGTLHMHQLAHSLGLVHSARRECDGSACSVSEPGDPSCPMGSGVPTSPSAFLCLAAPQAYRVGWAVPLRDLRATELLPSAEFELPAMSTGPRGSFLRVAVGPVRQQSLGSMRKMLEPALFLSYRSKRAGVPYDSGLGAELDQKVFVHYWEETQDGSPGLVSKPPLLWALLDAPSDSSGESNSNSSVFEYPVSSGGRLVVRMTHKTPASASVTVCYATVTRESDASCDGNGDDDCDGLADYEDPDCVGPVFKKLAAYGLTPRWCKGADIEFLEGGGWMRYGF